MRNIHVLPSDKPSRLLGYEITTNVQGIDKRITRFIFSKNINFYDAYKDIGYSSYLIYITSDEEIKEGDYVLNSEQETIFKPSTDEIYDIKNSESKYYEYCKKIIITNDDDLIKDRVQAINDKSLEWFIKNPNCEYVDVRRRYSEFFVDPFMDYEIIYTDTKQEIANIEMTAVEYIEKAYNEVSLNYIAYGVEISKEFFPNLIKDAKEIEKQQRIKLIKECLTLHKKL